MHGRCMGDTRTLPMCTSHVHVHAMSVYALHARLQRHACVMHAHCMHMHRACTAYAPQAYKTHFELLASVLQFSPREIAQVHAAKELDAFHGSTTALISSFFFAPSDLAAAGGGGGGAAEGAVAGKPSFDSTMQSYQQQADAAGGAAAASGGAAAAGGAVVAAAAASGEEAEELKRKVTRLKKLTTC